MITSIKYGIDFGTTNSSIAIMEENEDGIKVPFVFPVDMKNIPVEVIKSVVGFRNGEEVIGIEGLSKLDGNEDNPVRQVKMLLLDNHDDAEIAKVPGKKYTDAIAAILRHLKEKADQRLEKLNVKPDGVVIGIPCEIGEEKHRKAIIRAYSQALFLAGFFESEEQARKETVFLDEPLAVALFYGNNSSYQNKRTLVFDYGGGTLDLAIVDLKEQVENNEVNDNHKVLSKKSKYGAGEDITKLLFTNVYFNALKTQYYNGNAYEATRSFKKLGCNATRVEGIFDQLYNHGGECLKFIQALEDAKTKLSIENKCIISCTCKSEDGEEIVFPPTEVLRKDFEEALEPVIKEIRDILNSFMKETKNIDKDFEEESIECVVMAGGSSAIPCVRKYLEKRYPGKVRYDDRRVGTCFVNMMTCISQGLAVKGYLKKEGIENVANCDYGFYNERDKKIEVLIKKNTPLADTYIDFSRKGLPPASKYSIEVEQIDKNKRSFHIDICADKKKLGRLEFDKSHHSGSYKLYFSIDPRLQILEVHVYDTVAGRWIDDLDIRLRQFVVSEE